jgi:hypothetical protein
MSNVKLGLLVFWPTFWTGFPLKMVIVLLLLAAHIHPWEGTGLAALLLLSIPIDIWALGLCARTVFLERLSLDSPKGMGLRLWAHWAAFSAIYLPLLFFIVGGAKALAISATEATVHFVEESFMVIPVAEKITLELVMWTTPTTLVLIAMLCGWMVGLGALTQRQVRASTPVGGTFQDIVYQWDAIRIPKDQPLLLTAFMGAGVVVVFLFWGLIPVSTPHPHEEYEFIHVEKVEKRIVPKDVLKSAEKVLARAEATIIELEKKNLEGDKPKDDKKTAAKEEPKPSPK